MDLERELERVLHTRDTPLPVVDPVTAVRSGMRRRRRTQRLQVLTAGLGVTALVLGASLLVGNPLASTPAPQATSVPTPTSATAVPAGFTVQDLSFVSVDRGWALGTAPCGPDRCTVQLVTTDGGASWSRRPALGLPATCGEACVTKIRFADTRLGYAFGPSLFLTNDGGTHWSRIASRQVHALEIADGTVTQVVSTRPDCAPACLFAVQTSDVGSVAWTTTYTSDQLRVATAMARRGSRIAVPLFANPAGGAGDAHAPVLLSTDSGATWRLREDPCGAPSSNDTAEVDTHAVSFGPEGLLVALCTARGSEATAAVRVSTDSGRTFGPARALAGVALKVAAVGGDRLVAEVFDGGRDRLLLSRDAGRSWETVAEQAQPDGVLGTGFLAFSTPLTGTWVGADATSVWRTSDGGATWTEHPFR